MFGAINSHIHILLQSFCYLKDMNGRELLRESPYQHPTIMYHDYEQADLSGCDHKPVRHDHFNTYFAWILKQGVHDLKFVDFLLNFFRRQADQKTNMFHAVN